MKLYCPTCGAATNYSMSKPRFCASCGDSFAASGNTARGTAISKKQTAAGGPATPAPPRHEDEEEVFEVPDMDRLQYNLEISQDFNVVSLDKVAGTSQGTQSDGYIREADPTYSAESFADDFMRDAGSSRKNNAETQET
jgi:hypothetical protein|tara:strand:- start:1958 stop:2374 length:417 start_codon:yes stop_codon:yes gene_type:complete